MSKPMFQKSSFNQLTQREAQVLKHLVLGYIAKQIGKLLNLSFRTVESYVDNLKLKLHCDNKGELIRLVLKTDLVYKLGVLQASNYS